MKTSLRFGCLVLALAALVATSSKSFADSIHTYDLTASNGFAACSTLKPCGQVEVDINAAGTSVTIKVISLLSGYQFDNIFFNGPGTKGTKTNKDGTAGLSLTAGGGTLSYNFSPPPPNADGFGPFNYLYDSGVNGGVTGNACSGIATDADCYWSFTLSGSNITQSTFYTSGANNFAGHMQAPTGCTGYAGDGTNHSTTPATNCTPTTPEPAGFSLLFAGVLGLGGLVRARRKQG